jgi:hypothetical protein
MIEIHNTFHMNDSHLNKDTAEKVEDVIESSADLIGIEKQKTL